MRFVCALTASLLLASTTMAHPISAKAKMADQTAASVPESARAAAAVVDAFHAALRRGDTNAALSYLAESALIYEAGGVERGKQEYASHHLGADAAFARAVPGKITRRAGDTAGNVAWLATEGRTTGTYKGKAVDRVTAETMVLRRLGRAWKIVHIHWSSTAGVK